jgi:hypothetical protein
MSRQRTSFAQLIKDVKMTYRKQRSVKPKTLWSSLFFNPTAADSFETWKLIFESRRLCNEVDRSMKRVMTTEEYRAYRNNGKPERKPGRLGTSWLGRLFGGSQ